MGGSPAASTGETAGGQPGGFRVEFTDTDAGAADLFSDFFRSISEACGHRPAAPRFAWAARGQDLEVVAHVSLEDAYRASSAWCRQAAASLT